MFVYLAHPIDQVSIRPISVAGVQMDKVLTKVCLQLMTAGFGVFRPALAYDMVPTNRDQARFVDRINAEALAYSDGLVAILPAGAPTLGTPAEIETALSAERPVVIFTDIVASVQLAAWADRGATVIDLHSSEIPAADDLKKMLANSGPALGSFPRAPLPFTAPAEPPTLLAQYEPKARRLMRAYPTDAGLDLGILNDSVLHTGQPTMLATGVRVSIPDGWWGQITGRSSARTRHNVEVLDGVIDAGYTGELFIRAKYCGMGTAAIEAGTRLAQLILHPVWQGSVLTVSKLPDSPRGTNGFGSSGH